MTQHTPSLPQRVKKMVSETHRRLFKDVSLETMHAQVEELLNDATNNTDADKTIKINTDFQIRIENSLKLDSAIQSASKNTTAFNNHVYHDVEFFERFANASGGFGSTAKAAVFDAVNCCTLAGGKYVSKQVYSNPCDDISMLNKRTKYLAKIESLYAKRKDEVVQLMSVLKSNERHIAWLFEEKEDNLKELYDLVFFRLKGLQPLNKSATALTAYNWYRIFMSPIFGIVAPIMYFIIPYLVLAYKFKVRLPFKVYIQTIVQSIFSSEETLFGPGKHYKYIRIASYIFSAVFYFQGIFTSVDLAKTVHKMSKLLVNGLNGAVEYIKAAHSLSTMFWDTDFIESFLKVSNMELKPSEEEATFVSCLHAPQFSVFSMFGKHLRTYKFLDLSMIKSIVCKSYVVDALLGAVQYKLNNKFVYCEHIVSRTPVIHLQQMVHPCIESSKAVKNNFVLGANDENHAIITSPNSSGKSILIKSVIVNVLMAQTMGITSASHAIISPFRFVNTQINVPDSTGHESLFEAEMHRCKHNLDVLKSLEADQNSNKLSLIVMDEIFNSTNPIEAVAGAYAVCKRMSSYSTNMLIFTTHFNYLTKLVREKDHKFVNYRMQTVVSKDNIKFTYKLEKGVNKHLLALELLRKSGFDDSILQDAIEIKNSLVSKVNRKADTTKVEA